MASVGEVLARNGKQLSKIIQLLEEIENGMNTGILLEILQTLQRIEQAVSSSPAARVVFYVVDSAGQKIQVDHMNLKLSQKLPLAVEFLDKFNNPAPVDGVPSWSVTDPSLAQIVPAADGLSAELIPIGPLGSFKVQCSADADLGEGLKPILGELDIDLLPAEASVVNIKAGTPVDV